MKKSDKRRRLPVVYCTYHKGDTLVQIQRFINKKTKCIVSLVSCQECDLCLNIDKSTRIRWWLEETVKRKLGWFKND